MSKEENLPAETAESVAEEDEMITAPQLGVADLKLAANIIEVVSNRGAIKANEMVAVGSLYNKLMEFLVANGAVEMQQQEPAEDSAEAPAEESAEDAESGDES